MLSDVRTPLIHGKRVRRKAFPPRLPPAPKHSRGFVADEQQDDFGGVPALNRE
jgi:hypothetical protein